MQKANNMMQDADMKVVILIKKTDTQENGEQSVTAAIQAGIVDDENNMIDVIDLSTEDLVVIRSALGVVGESIEELIDLSKEADRLSDSVGF